MPDIFDFTSYREFLKSAFPAKGEGRGRRRELSLALACQTSFISLILTERAHLNEDMAYQTAQFLHFNPTETSYFLMLYRYERAGTIALKKYYEKQINDILEKRMEVKERIGAQSVLSLEQQAEYYSDWSYSAIHTVIMNPEMRTPSIIAEKLNLKLEVVIDRLKHLEEWALIRRHKDIYEPGVTRIHLGSESPFVVQHHRNWHLEAMKIIGERRKNDLNYSGALSLSKSDVEKVRAIFLNAIEKTEKQIAPSADEELIGLTLSLFQYG